MSRLPPDTKLIGQIFLGPSEVKIPPRSKSSKTTNGDATDGHGDSKKRIEEHVAIQISKNARDRVRQATDAAICICSVGPGQLYMISREVLNGVEWGKEVTVEKEESGAKGGEM